MMELHLIIFCLNRPILCEHLLQSIYDNLDGDIILTILYGATNSDYENGFDILRKRFSNSRITYIRKFQGGYRTPRWLLLRPRNLFYYLKYPYYRDRGKIFNFKFLLEKILHESVSNYVTFLTDDSFFYRKVNWNKEIARVIHENSEQNSFSFRHGMNIRNVPLDCQIVDKLISWNYGGKGNDGHWSYRFSIDGHIYDRKFLLSFIKKILYINPNTFEAVVCRYAELQHVFNKGYSFRDSVLAGSEINRVQNVSPNNNLGIDNIMLNQQYLKGFRLNLVLDEDANVFRPDIKKLTLFNQATGKEVLLLQTMHSNSYQL